MSTYVYFGFDSTMPDGKPCVSAWNIISPRNVKHVARFASAALDERFFPEDVLVYLRIEQKMREYDKKCNQNLSQAWWSAQQCHPLRAIEPKSWVNFRPILDNNALFDEYQTRDQGLIGDFVRLANYWPAAANLVQVVYWG